MHVHFTLRLELDWLPFKQVLVYKLSLFISIFSLLCFKYHFKIITFPCGHYYNGKHVLQAPMNGGFMHLL